MEYTQGFTPQAGEIGQLLEVLAHYFNYVVVDVPQRGGWLAEEVLDRASTVCLVADPSVHSARTLVRLSQAHQARSDTLTLRAVLNHVQPASRSHVHVKDFVAAVDMPVQVRIAYDAKAPALTENAGVTLPSRSEFHQGVALLAAQITGEHLGTDRKRWWQRLRSWRAA